MDETTLKIAIAGFMHDIGKLLEDADVPEIERYVKEKKSTSSHSPHGKHRHTNYTEAFLLHLKDDLPQELFSPKWGEGDSFLELAASHHAPTTPFQWIVTVAQYLSKGWNREKLETDLLSPEANEGDNKGLVTIFEQIRLRENRKKTTGKELLFQYPIEALWPSSIFPKNRKDLPPALEGYKELSKDIIKCLKKIPGGGENLLLWYEHFDSLMLAFTSCISASRIGSGIPDIPLYDHGRVSSALAAALYLYHKETGTLEIDSVKDYDKHKFLIVSGDFYGIQSFIFSEHGDTRKYRSKLLRGRSFMISLLCEMAMDRICGEVGIPATSVILNAAGKFVIIAPNTDRSRKAINSAKDEINDWLVRTTYGESTIGLSITEASPNDLVSGNFVALWEKMSGDLEKEKFCRIDLIKHGGVIPGYLDEFRRDTHPLCSLCGKRPADPDIHDRYIKKSEASCPVCRDQVFVGTNLVKKDRLLITATGDRPQSDNKGEDQLLQPIFDRYQLSFDRDDQDSVTKRPGLVKYWNLTYGRESSSKNDDFISLKFISGYIPRLEEDDWKDKRIEKASRDLDKEELKEMAKAGDPKTFEHIAALAREIVKEDGKEYLQGTEALGILKADVDELGLLVSCGMEESKFSLSALSVQSRFLHYFFSLYLPYLLEKETEYRDIYTVFAGGDDLFLIGPWNKILGLVVFLRDAFAEYVCRNKEVHFSAGVSLHGPNTPLDVFAEKTEEAVKKSKNSGRNRITVFGETVPWEEYAKLNEVKKVLTQWVENRWVNNAMLYRLNELLEMAGKEKRLVKNDTIHVRDLSCTKWRSLLTYTGVRNIARDVKDEEERNRIIDEVLNKLALWFANYGSALKIPLWDILYSSRKEGINGRDKVVEG